MDRARKSRNAAQLHQGARARGEGGDALWNGLQHSSLQLAEISFRFQGVKRVVLESRRGPNLVFLDGNYLEDRSWMNGTVNVGFLGKISAFRSLFVSSFERNRSSASKSVVYSRSYEFYTPARCTLTRSFADK